MPGICNAFYQCSNGIWWDKQYCPDGLLFNPEVDVCDWPENVECDGQKDVSLDKNWSNLFIFYLRVVIFHAVKTVKVNWFAPRNASFPEMMVAMSPKFVQKTEFSATQKTVQNSTTVQTVLSLRPNSALQVQGQNLFTYFLILSLRTKKTHLVWANF